MKLSVIRNLACGAMLIVASPYRDYLRALQARVAELKKEGKSSDEAAAQARTEFARKHPDWAQPARIYSAATVIYGELP
jgi:hypothetical protein